MKTIDQVLEFLDSEIAALSEYMEKTYYFGINAAKKERWALRTYKKVRSFIEIEGDKNERD